MLPTAMMLRAVLLTVVLLTAGCALFGTKTSVATPTAEPTAEPRPTPTAEPGPTPTVVPALVAPVAPVPAPAAAPVAPSVRKARLRDTAPVDSLAGGMLWRIEDPEHGPVRVWRPAGYSPRNAGVVVYVHGHGTMVDSAWMEHRLATQLAESHQNALFIVPEGQQFVGDPLRWPQLDQLLKSAAKATGEPLPSGPLVVMGHSGAYRLIARWLGERTVRHVILLDGMYGDEAEYRAWFLRGGHKLTLVSFDTRRNADRFRRGLGAVRRSSVPATFEGFTARERRAALLVMLSQYEHMEIVTSGKVIPVVLRLSALKRVSARTPRK